MLFRSSAYDAVRNTVNLDALQKGQRVKTIIDFNQIWIIDNKFGLSVRLKQVMMMPTTELNGCAFGDDFVEEVVNGDSEQADDEV